LQPQEGFFICRPAIVQPKTVFAKEDLTNGKAPPIPLRYCRKFVLFRHTKMDMLT
jgi:hypothetical protein